MRPADIDGLVTMKAEVKNTIGIALVFRLHVAVVCSAHGESIRVGLCSVGAAMSSVWVTKEAGYFDNENLATQLVYVPEGRIHPVKHPRQPYNLSVDHLLDWSQRMVIGNSSLDRSQSQHALLSILRRAHRHLAKIRFALHYHAPESSK